jgi:hypothetical protein
MTKKSEPSDTGGYGKPPERTQFKPGRSGNPNGRPRKTTTFKDDVEAEMCSKIMMSVNGKPLKITKRRAMVKVQINEALKGNLASTKLLFNTIQHLQCDEPDDLDPLLKEFQERNHQMTNRSGEDEDSTTLAGNQSSTHERGEKPE